MTASKPRQPHRVRDPRAADRSPELISAALPYVNAPPHVGHALEIVQADVLARYRRLAGADVRFVTGADENSLKNVRAADAGTLSLEALVAANADRLLELDRDLHASLDGFVRTSIDPTHASTAAWLFRRCRERGDIYKKSYRGLYCVGCEQFYKASDLADGLCPEHERALELVEEENYFFRLSEYAPQLTALIQSGRLEITPRERRNEVLQFIAHGLEDFSVSRTRTRAKGWGIPVPDDDAQVIFVWFDALGGYLSAARPAENAQFWRHATRRTHVIGKGIVRFHAVYWPALLLSAGLPPPTRICVHGYLTIGGKKIGKSLGNVVDPFSLIERFGADALRYYLLRHFATTLDGDFCVERLHVAYDSELANQLGNLVQRSAGLLGRYAVGVVPSPEPAAALPVDLELIRIATTCVPEIEGAIESFDLRHALGALWELVSATNRYIDRSEPWALHRRGEHARLRCVLYAVAEAVRVIGVLLAPFLPQTARAIAQRLAGDAVAAGAGCAPTEVAWTATSWGQLQPGVRFEPGPPLFPRLALSSERGE